MSEFLKKQVPGLYLGLKLTKFYLCAIYNIFLLFFVISINAIFRLVRISWEVKYKPIPLIHGRIM